MDNAAIQDLEFYRKHDGSTAICLKSREREKGGWPAKYAFCIKLSSTRFKTYEGSPWDSGGKELGEFTPEELVKEWLID